MIRKKDKKINDYRKYRLMALKRVRVTAIIIFLYVLGSNIYLPGITPHVLSNFMSQNASLSLITGATGFNLNQVSVFTLGLGPWMSTLILWRGLTLIPSLSLKNMPEKKQYQIKYVLALIIGTIQAYGLLASGTVAIILNTQHHNQYETVVILVSGMAFLIWLGELNAQYGLGSYSMLILCNMMLNIPSKLWQGVSQIKTWQAAATWLVGICILILLVYTSIIMLESQKRIPIMRVLLHNTYATKSYLPIPVNPSGGMPFMYASSILLIPQYILSIWQQKAPHNHLVKGIYESLNVTTPTGVAIMLGVVTLLSFSFAYVNIDPDQIAEGLRNSGDYIPNVVPGEATKRYISKKIGQYSIIGAVYNVIIMGIPLFLGLFSPRDSWTISVGGYVLISVSILLMAIRQFRGLYSQGNEIKLISV